MSGRSVSRSCCHSVDILPMSRDHSDLRKSWAVVQVLSSLVVLLAKQDLNFAAVSPVLEKVEEPK